MSKMKPKKHNPFLRHFMHGYPTFGTAKNKKKAGNWQGSVYYLWWQYLKQNEGYLATCEAGGTGEFAKLYANFGDVRGDDFKEWWNEKDPNAKGWKDGRGARLFAEPRTEERGIRVLATGEAALDSEEVLTLSIPLYLSKLLIVKHVRELLVQQHKGKRGVRQAKSSQALYKVGKQPNIEALQQGLIVYDYWKSHPELTLWEIGNAVLRIEGHAKIKPSDPKRTTVDTRNVLAATVSRYLKRTKATIEKTGLGMFP